jgi:hypothetical protein
MRTPTPTLLMITIISSNGAITVERSDDLTDMGTDELTISATTRAIRQG